MNPDKVESECLTLSADAEDEKCVSATGRRMDMADTVWAEEDDSGAPSIESKGPSLVLKTCRKPIHPFFDWTGSTSPPREKKNLRSPRLTKLAYKTALETHSLGSFHDDDDENDSKDSDVDLTVFMAQYTDALDLGVDNNDDNDDPVISLSFEKSLSTLATVDENHSVTEHDLSHSSLIEDDSSTVEVPKKHHRRKRYSKDPGTVWVTDGSSSSKPHLELNVPLLTTGMPETIISSDISPAQSKPIMRTGRRQARKQRAVKIGDKKPLTGKDPTRLPSRAITHKNNNALGNQDEDLEGSMGSFSESTSMVESRRTRHASAQEFGSYLEDKEIGHQSFPQVSRLKGSLQQIRGLVVKQRMKKETSDDLLHASTKSLTSPMGPRLTLQNIELIKQMTSKKELLEEML